MAIVLPAGWRLPTTSDYNALFSNEGALYIDGFYRMPAGVCFKLMSKTSWQRNDGNNSSGFSATAAGFYDSYYGPTEFAGLGTDAVFLAAPIRDVYTGVELAQSFDIRDGPAEDPLTTIITPNLFIGYTNIDRGSVRFVKDN